MKKRKKKEFDMLIRKGFEEFCRREDERLPTDEELKKLFPPIRTNNEDVEILFLSRVIGGIDDKLIIDAEKSQKNSDL
ncbi:MAG: hypothetical protein IKI03_09000 [Clostridia bacterium]|nr:hypothetical protein [Clostridia bacterium]